MSGRWVGGRVDHWVGQRMDGCVDEWVEACPPAAQSLFSLRVREPRTQKQESCDWGLFLVLKPFHYSTFNKQICNSRFHLLIFKQEQAPGAGNGQGSLVCCSPCDHKESKGQTRLSYWTDWNRSDALWFLQPLQLLFCKNRLILWFCENRPLRQSSSEGSPG